MIRQAISCDICGTEMLNANHWFIAYDRGLELRIGVWSKRIRIKAGVRHLCGHKCLHKLVDDFMARMLSARALASVEGESTNITAAQVAVSATDTSLTAFAHPKMAAVPIIGSYVEDFDSSARLIRPTTETITSRPASAATALHAEAWKRERQRLAEETASSRRSIA